jgi:hypothetical protein
MLDVLFEIVLGMVLQVLFRLPGYYCLRCVYRRAEIDLEGDRVLFVGILLWVLVGVTVALIVWLG